MKCFHVLPVSMFKYDSIRCFNNKEFTLKHRWGTEASGDNSDAWKQTGWASAALQPDRQLPDMFQVYWAVAL